MIRLVGEISATAARMNIETWSWSDATLSKAFLETVESKMQSTDSLQQIAAMDALAAFGYSSDKGRRVMSVARSLAILFDLSVMPVWNDKNSIFCSNTEVFVKCGYSSAVVRRCL